MSEGEGTTEMVTDCFCRGKQPEAERRWPKNSILETANSHLGRPIVRLCFLQRKKTSRRFSTWEESSFLKMRMSST